MRAASSLKVTAETAGRTPPMPQAIGTSSLGSPPAVRTRRLSMPGRHRHRGRYPIQPALTRAFILRPTATRHPEAEARKRPTTAAAAAAAVAAAAVPQVPFTLCPTAMRRPGAEARKRSTATAPRTRFALCPTAVLPMTTLSI